MGGKNQFPKTAFEPYQCCPSKPSRSTKVSKSTSTTKQVTSSKSTRPTTTKPTQSVIGKESKVIDKPMAKVSTANKHIKERDNVKKDVKQDKDKGKGKKGFFGTGKYIWWW